MEVSYCHEKRGRVKELFGGKRAREGSGCAGQRTQAITAQHLNIHPIQDPTLERRKKRQRRKNLSVLFLSLFVVHVHDDDVRACCACPCPCFNTPRAQQQQQQQQEHSPPPPNHFRRWTKHLSVSLTHTHTHKPYSSSLPTSLSHSK